MTMRPVKAELIAPAGDFERLKFAYHYGADAVYCGGKSFGLRAFAGNFSLDELKTAADYSHALGKRIYLAANAFMKESDICAFKEYAAHLGKTGIDAVIVADAAAFDIVRETLPLMEVHISTQANTLSSRAAEFWHKLGAKRIILGRELSIDEIRSIREGTPDSLELEAFVHGAMCVSYSGRCLLSKYLSGRDANSGACSQPCRWSCDIRPDKTGGWLTAQQDERNTYIFNSKDLMMIEHLGALIESGVTGLKIEGRMKTLYYVACVTNAYKIALNGITQGSAFDGALLDEMQKYRHRPYTTAFYFNEENDSGICYDGRYEQQMDFCAIVLNYDGEKRLALVEQRNRFFAGEDVEVLTPGALGAKTTVLEIIDMDGKSVDSAPNPQQRLWIKTDIPLKKWDILRRGFTDKREKLSK